MMREQSQLVIGLGGLLSPLFRPCHRAGYYYVVKPRKRHIEDAKITVIRSALRYIKYLKKNYLLVITALPER